MKPVFTEEDDNFILSNYRPGKVNGPDHRPGLTTKQIAIALGRKHASIISRYHILMGNREGRVYYKTSEPKATERISTPSLAKTKFEDLDPGKYDD